MIKIHFPDTDKAVTLGEKLATLPTITEFLRIKAYLVPYILLFLAAMIAMSVTVLIENYSFSLAAIIVLFNFFIIFIIVAPLANDIAVRKIKVDRVAKLNNAQASYNITNPSLSGSIFEHSYGRICEILQFPTARFSIGTYEYPLMGTSSSQVSFILSKLDRNVPHIIIARKKSSDYLLPPKGVSSRQQIKLEGDFSKKYDTYVPSEYDVDARYILTPDVMAAFMDNDSFDVAEIVGNSFYVYKSIGNNSSLADPSVAEPLLEGYEKLREQLINQANSYNDDRSHLSDMPNPGLVAPSGRQLRYTVRWSLVLGTAVLFAIYLGFAASRPQ